MSGFESSKRHSATRRFSPPDSVPIFASHGGKPQRVGGDLQLLVAVVAAFGKEDRFEFRLLFGQRFEIRIGFAVRCEDFIEPLARGVRFGERLFDRFANGFVRVEFRFLLQIADR